MKTETRYQMQTAAERARRLLGQVDELTSRVESLRGTETSQILYQAIQVAAKEIARRRGAIQRDIRRLQDDALSPGVPKQLHIQ